MIFPEKGQMNLIRNRLWHIALLWGLALMLVLAPMAGPGMGHAHAMAGAHASGMDGQGLGFASATAFPEVPSAGLAHHDCAQTGAAADAPREAAASSGQNHGPSAPHSLQMTCCDGICLMSCHGILMPPAAFALPVGRAQAHEARSVPRLKTQPADVLLPPPRTDA